MNGNAVMEHNASLRVEIAESMRAIIVSPSLAFSREVESAAHSLGYDTEHWRDFRSLGARLDSLNGVFLLLTDDRNANHLDDSDLNDVRETLGKCPVWIHVSKHSTTAEVVRLMKMGLDEYLVQSLESADLVRILRKSAAHFHRRKEIERRSQENTAILRRQIEWLTYKESLRNAGDDTSGKKAIENLKTSLSQGAGFGLMLSLMEMVHSMVEDRGDHYVLDKDLVHSIRDNAAVVRRMLLGLEEYIAVMGRTALFRIVSVHSVQEAFRFRFSHLKPYLSRKNMSLQIPSGGSGKQIMVDLDLLFLGLEELLINAWKYSKAGSEIAVLTAARDGYYSIIIKSYPEDYGAFALNHDLATELKKPFFRHHPPVEEVIHVERFVMGLGLSAVEHIVNKHNGFFVIEGGTDHTGESLSSCFLARVMLPLV